MTKQDLIKLKDLLDTYMLEFKQYHGTDISDISFGSFYTNILTKILHKEISILDKEEKEYLSAVIKPFKKQINNITKRRGFSLYRFEEEYISIELNRGMFVDLPYFRKGNMYKGMELNKHYTLKELGLD